MNPLPHPVRAPRGLAWPVLLCLALPACGDAVVDGHDDHDDHAPPATNRIDVPELVRQNLGIEFTRVERRRVAATLRLPAEVELLPSATRHYPAPLTGRVTLAVAPLQRVAPGDLLYTLDSPEWRRRQQEIAACASDLAVTEARLRAMPPLLLACEQHERSLREAHEITRRYVDDLEAAQQNVGGQGQKIADAKVDLARLGAQIAEASEKHTETETRRIELTTQLQTRKDELQLLLASAAATLGLDEAALAGGDPGRERWRTLATVEVRASQRGVVDRVAVTNGSLVAAQDAVLTTVDPQQVRCRARALQSDLGALRTDQPAAIVPAAATASHAPLAGSVQLGPQGDVRTRTFELFVTPDAVPEGTFARPGHAVFVELVTAAGEAPELAIPRSSVLPDGLDLVFFRRDPKDPDKVIRVVADLGVDDGSWVEVRSGLVDGDEVVTKGAFELVLASSQQAPKGGHFHADGTWHEDR